MESELKPSDDSSQQKAPIPLDYLPRRERHGFKALVSKGLARMSRPMPLAAYYVIMFVLSVVATVIAAIVVVIARGFH